MNGCVSIKELIRMVQKELMESQAERIKEGQPVLFETSELEIELNTVLEQNADGKCTIGVPLLKSEINIKGNEQFVQKIKLKFKVSNTGDFIPSDEDEEFLPPRDDSRLSGRYPRLDIEVMDDGKRS